ncbi:MAG: DNA adenine methylase [Kiritimatiellae bacterium]|nr:DNA adenine methylase [Kiritimatiellia bacterium]
MKRESSKDPKPFLKWVGGKTQLLSELEARLPADFIETVRVYAEPFVGGGALLFRILSRPNRLERVIVNDCNIDLANAWRVVQAEPDALIAALSRFQAEYTGLPDEAGRKNFYLGVRSAFNAGHPSGNSPDVGRAALLLFLNRTCFNGLYRVNNKGLFNVPFGKYAHPGICDELTIRSASAVLSGVKINCGDFTDAVVDAGPGWFIYFDPPYRPVSDTSAFCDYTRGGFGDDEQRRLAECCRRLDAAGAGWMLSNSDAPDGFFDELYRGFRIDRVRAARAINAKGDGRGKVSEIIVRNIREAH